jgi:predicted dehydrogenase
MKKMRKMRLFQKDAYIGIDFLDKKTEIIKLDKNESAEKAAFTFDIETPQGNKTIAIENPNIKDVNAIEAELTAFRDAIANNTRPPVNELDGFMAMEVAHEILTKIHSNALNQS